MSASTVRQDIDEFWASSRLAVVGVARDPKEFGHRLYEDLRKWGYDAVPVNPRTDAIGEVRAYHRVQEIEPHVEAALLLTAPSVNEQIIKDCAEAGVKMVWFYGVGDWSHENAAAIAYAREHGMTVIPGYCPYMFLSRAPFFHKMHGFVARWTGQCPR
ncbi:MAG: CoA-binding protein [Nitrososphaerales archaeon]